MENFYADEILKRIRSLFAVETNKDLGKELGFSQQVVSGWVTRNSIPLDVLLRVGNEKNVSLDWLVYAKETKGIVLNPLEELVLTAFNGLDDKAKIQMISLLHTGGKNELGISQTSGDNGSNNIFSGDNVTINTTTNAN